MRHMILAALLAATAPAAFAAPVPKEQLLVPPKDAAHYVVVSEAGKHGDMWRWTLPDGRIAYRHSQALRGWITETDQVVTLGPNGLPDDRRSARDHAERRRGRDADDRRTARRCGRAPPIRGMRRCRVTAFYFRRAAFLCRTMLVTNALVPQAMPGWIFCPAATRR